MKPRKPMRKPGNYVIRKPSGGHGTAHGGEGWAVSYADLLMVLLSFFILFFSFEEPQPKRDPLPQKLVNAMELSLDDLLNLNEDAKVVFMEKDQFETLAGIAVPMPAKLVRKGLPKEASLDDLMADQNGEGDSETPEDAALAGIAIPMPGKKARKGLPKEASMDDLLAEHEGQGDSETPEDAALAGIAIPMPGKKVRKGLPKEASMEDLMAEQEGDGDSETPEDSALAGIAVPMPGKKARKGIPIEASMEDLMAENTDPNANPQTSDIEVPTPVRGIAVTNRPDPMITANEAKLKIISEALNLHGVRVKAENSQLVVTMDNSAFDPASFELRPQLRMRLNDVLSRLRPHFATVQLTVVGHADRSKLLSKSKLLEDNFDLSSIRALKVLKYIVSKGFPENRASARAASFFDRDARSVTIVIQAAPDTIKKGSG